VSDDKRPLKRGWEVWVAVFVAVGALATVGYAVGETFWG
jgi:hypothetical protein